MHDSVTVHMEASPAEVWDLVSDVTKIGRYSPETFEAQWLDGATGPGVGVKFRGHVKRNGRGPIYWTTCTVLECEPERVFAFGVGNSERPLNVWKYEMSPAGNGTDVTESFTLAPRLPLRLYWALFGWARGKTNRNGMQATLERIRDEVQRS
ncbi:MAG TPA: SRPBCC family protein [Acidimicrobiales bacterium]|nr:SRPBCC family protein [Acidimicrobiales bacterium]